MKKYLLGIVVIFAAVVATEASAGKFKPHAFKYYKKFTGPTASPTVTQIHIDESQVGNQSCPTTQEDHPCLIELTGPNGAEILPAIRTRPVEW